MVETDKNQVLHWFHIVLLILSTEPPSLSLELRHKTIMFGKHRYSLFLQDSYKEKKDEITKGKRILSVSKRKLRELDSEDSESPELRKLLLVSRTLYLAEWKINTLNSEKGILKIYDNDEPEEVEMVEEQDNEKEFDSGPYLFDNVNICKVISGIHLDNVSDVIFKSYDDSFSITSNDKFSEIDRECDDDSLIATVSSGVSRELYVISNSDHDDVECHEYNKVVEYIDHDYGRKPSVVVSKDSHEISVSRPSGKRDRNPDEENALNETANQVVYKKVRRI